MRGVVSAAGSPQAGVTLRLGTAGRTRAATSDERGRFEIRDVAAGAYALSAALPARSLGAFVPVDVGMEGEILGAVVVKVELRPTVRLSGQVHDELGHPLLGAFVRLEEEERALPVTIETGADGRFAIEGRLRGAAYRLLVQRAGYLPDGPRAVKAGGPPIEVRMRRGATLEGLVVDERGAPVAGAEIAVVSEEEGGEVPRGEGSRGEPAIGAAAAPIGDGWAQLDPSGELGVLRGGIPFPPLRPPPAASRSPGSQLPRSDGKGGFRIAELPAGRLIVTARHPDFAGAAAVPVALIAGASRSVRLQLVRGATVRGRVLDERRLGVADVEVSTSDGRTVLSDPAGGFVIEHVARNLRLSARRRGFLRGETEVEVSPGQAELACELVLQRALGRLGGEVSDARGAGIEGARLSIAPHGGEPVRVTTDRAGRFFVDGLPDGPYHVVVEHAAWAMLTLPAIEATSEARLVLEAGGGIEGELLDPRLGVPPADATLEVVVAGERRRVPLAGRRFRLLALPSGPARLVASARGYPRIERAVDILAADRAGEVTVRDLRLELELGGQLRGRVRDDRGDPIAGAQITVDSPGVDPVRSGADGAYALVGVPSGRVEVSAELGERSARDEVEVRANEESRLDLVLPSR